MNFNTAIYRAKDVAGYIIEYANSTGRLVSNLKLQSILYFVQAEFLVSFKRPCFREDMIAWQCGPIVPDVYLDYMVFGSGGIPVVRGDSKGGEVISWLDQETINGIVDEISDHSASYLLNLIYDHTPYRRARYIYIQNHNRITNEDLYEFFKEP